ncbi:MAG: chromosomal replication initiator DnaA [Parvibaculaceae bacterium]|nr:chromosomal replication initiator DnaA [Parvibaculaceae bacterium]
MARQLILALPCRTAYGREDFLVAPANEAAVALIDRWPDWPGVAVALTGPAGSGKTHLAEVWRERSRALTVTGPHLRIADVPVLLAKGALVIEAANELSGEGEQALFHLLNLAHAENAFVLLLARPAPGQWRVKLPDLASRVKALPAVSLNEPDDALLGAVLAKLFADRQLRIPDTLVPFLAQRIERSVDAARRIVQAIDEASLSGKRPVTIPLAADVLVKG